MPLVDKDTERAWLIALQEGSHTAFEQLYHRHKRAVFYRVLRLVHQPQIAEELTHDVFLKIWQLRTSIDTNQSFTAFLQRVGTNLAIDCYRRAATDKKIREELIHSATRFYNPTEKDDWAAGRNIIRSVVDKLPPRRKEVFVLCKLEGKSYAEVAEMLGIGVGTINDHIVKATKFLREEVLKSRNIDLLLLVLFAWL